MSRRKSFPFSILFMLVVAAFAAWVYFAEYKGGEEREKAKSEASAILPFSNADVFEISIHTVEQQIELKKEGAKEEPTWKVEKPYADRGDKSSVDSFLSTLSGEKTTDTVIEGAGIAWATYGLEKPQLEATLKAKTAGGEKKRTIQIGSVPAYDGSVYVRLDGENKVMLAVSTLKAALEKDAREFRDKQFFPTANVPDFKEIDINRVGYPRLHFGLKDETWVELPAKAGQWPLDQGAVKAFAQTVSGLRGNDVWAEDKSDAKTIKLRKLDKPAVTVVLIPESKIAPKYELKVAGLAKEESVAAAVGSFRPLIFSLYKAQIDSLSKSADDFRDLKYPFQFKIADVRGAELERPKGEVSLPVLLKKDGAWILDPVDTNFQGRELEPDKVDRLMTDLTGLHAKKLLPLQTPQPKRTDKGSVRIGLYADKNKRIIEFVFSPHDEVYHVSSSIIPNRVFEIDKAQFETLTLDLVKPPPAPAVKDPVKEKGKP